MCLQDDAHVGFMSMVEHIVQSARPHLERLNARRRQTVPASALVVGVQCGGSDAFSGVTANPAMGFMADLIVRAGGTVADRVPRRTGARARGARRDRERPPQLV